MTEIPDVPSASTPESVKSVAQTQEGSRPSRAEVESPAPCLGEEESFVIGKGVPRAVEGQWHDRESNQPVYRPLKIFALDPSVSKLEGATAVVNVPYEPLKPGPIGVLFCVSSASDGGQQEHPPLNLEDPNILISSGIEPSTWEKRFHEQMVYAVCSVVYTAFRTALGRHIVWGFKKPADGRVQLLIKPRAFQSNNSYYDRDTGELCFGYYKSTTKEQFPGHVYACLSHDTVAHEVTHALLDGLREHFSLPTSPDVPAFHEGFADLVAVFQHFSYEQVVRAAIRKSRGNLTRADLLTDIARQLGQTGREYKSALRSAIDYGRDMQEEKKKSETEGEGGADKKGELRYYNDKLEAHDLGSVLVLAVFEAFITVYRRKTERIVRLATGGSGRLPEGELPYDLQIALAEKASKLASQFLTMCIRAVDYCPPVDVTFGEYLRAVITADKDLVPDDPWAYREAWVDAFRRYRIYPNSVLDLSEDALLWRGPHEQNPPYKVQKVAGLTFADLQFDGDPGRPASVEELRRQACVLGQFVTRPEYMRGFGLTVKGDPLLNGDDVELPVVQSVRTSRRIGPNGQVVFDVVAEVIQLRLARIKGSDAVCRFYGGSTIIIDPRGIIRYVMRKGVMNNQRLNEQIRFLESPQGAKYKSSFYGMGEPRQNFFMMLHEEHLPAAEAPAPSDAKKTDTKPHPENFEERGDER
jgi:hypothetical protein